MRLNIDQVRDHLRRGGAQPELIASVGTLLMYATRPNLEQAIGEMTAWRNYHADYIVKPTEPHQPSQTEIDEARRRTGIGLR